MISAGDIVKHNNLTANHKRSVLFGKIAYIEKFIDGEVERQKLWARWYQTEEEALGAQYSESEKLATTEKEFTTFGFTYSTYPVADNKKEIYSIEKMDYSIPKSKRFFQKRIKLLEPEVL